MRSPGAALGWEFRRRYQWPLAATIAYLIVLAAMRFVIGAPSEPVRLIPPDGRAGVAFAPLSTACFYYLAVFSFGFSGDLAARESIFPRRMLTLPLSTPALAAWPMLYGALTIGGMVLVGTLTARWPWGIESYIVAPPLVAIAFLWWTQALMWTPYGLRGLRVAATVTWLALLDAVVLLAVHFNVSERMMIAVVVPQLPLAYVAACRAVARARSGDTPDWRLTLVRRPGAEASAARARPFRTAAQAQAWFEWRRQGRILPSLTLMALPVEVALLWLARDAPGFVAEILVLVMVTPIVLASFVATTVSRANPDAADTYGLSAFTATRPLSSAALVGAKLRMAAWSAALTWTIVLVATAAALQWSGTMPIVSQRFIQLAAEFGAPRVVALTLVVIALLLSATWKQLVQGLCIGLTGRPWLIRANVIGWLAIVVVAAPLLDWIGKHKAAQALVFSATPAILAMLVVAKMAGAAWVAARLARGRVVSDTVLRRGAVRWTVGVFALYGVLGWMVYAPLIPQYLVLLVAIIFVPLSRVSAAPLALAWNRHR